MSALPVAQYLRDLGSESGRARGGKSTPELASARKAEVDSRVEEAHALGVAEGRAAAWAELDARLVQHTAAAEQKLVAERQQWTSEESERLSGQIVSALSNLEVRIGDQIARILKPVLVAQVERRALTELVEAVDGLLSKGEIAKLAVSGPHDLIEKLRVHLDGRIANVSFIPTTDCDLRVTADETILETRIGAWAHAIEGAKE